MLISDGFDTKGDQNAERVTPFSLPDRVAIDHTMLKLIHISVFQEPIFSPSSERFILNFLNRLNKLAASPIFLYVPHDPLDCQ